MAGQENSPTQPRPARAFSVRRGAPAPAKSSPVEAKLGSVDYIVAEVIRELYEGVLVPGQKLKEVELMHRLKVGRSTVREALKRLEAEGLITVSLHRGACVRRLTRKAAQDIMAVAESVTALCARLAAERLSDPADRRLLEETLELLSVTDHVQTPLELAQARDRFYREMTRISENEELIRMMPLIQAHIVRVQFPSAYAPARQGKRLSSYAAIIKTLLAGDGAAAERAMRRHAHVTARTILALPDAAFAPTSADIAPARKA